MLPVVILLALAGGGAAFVLRGRGEPHQQPGNVEAAGAAAPGPLPSPAARAAPTLPAGAPRPAEPSPAGVPRIVEETSRDPAARRSVPSYWFEGASGFERASREQKDARVPLLIYFRVDWCPACRKVDSDVLPASEVRRFLNDVVKVRVNPSRPRQTRR